MTRRSTCDHENPEAGPLSPRLWPGIAECLVFDRRSIQAVDREAIESYGIPGIVLMENASRGLAEVVIESLGDRRGKQPSVLICCGPGNNGGDGYALARHLHNRGVVPLLAPLAPPRPGGDAHANATICERMGIRRLTASERDDAGVDLVVDALLGTGLDRPVRDEPAEWIGWINEQDRPVIAVDVPSGLDCNSGEPLGEAVIADHTVTFVGLKDGFLAPGARRYLGRVTVVDIGAPVELYRRHGRPLTDLEQNRSG